MWNATVKIHGRCTGFVMHAQASMVMHGIACTGQRMYFYHQYLTLMKLKYKPLMVCSVPGSSQGKGPTFDCHTSLYGLDQPNSCITKLTVAPTSAGYGSPRFMTYCGTEWAENKRTTSFLVFWSNFSSSWRMFLAKVLISFGWVGHRSITLHLILLSSLKSTLNWSNVQLP